MISIGKRVQSDDISNYTYRKGMSLLSKSKKFWILIVPVIILYSCSQISQNDPGNTPGRVSGIDISETYPQYWNYNGEPTLLLGGSVEDNLFQIENLEEHLDLLVNSGGNYIRNTMSSRDEGNLWPFRQLEDSTYDLDEFNEAYWERFENFLKETGERDVIVQIEVWATFDFYRDNWLVNPFNPKNNINYNERRSKLPPEVPSHPIFTENNFFRSVPRQMSLAVVLEYQQKFVDKLLSYSLQHDHVLYCMDNETSVTADWGEFWADYIQEKAREAGKTVHTTEMWDPWDLSHPFHRSTFNHPKIYSFVDISQNNHITGEEHWHNGLTQIEKLRRKNVLRPVTNVKVYGNDGGRHQTTQQGIEAFIRSILFGSSSARFHRPTSGQGLNEIAQNVIRSVRAISDSTDFFIMEPSLEILGDRSSNEAYARCIPGESYIVYFPAGGEVTLQFYEEDENMYNIRWLNILQSQWGPGEHINGKQEVQLTPPSDSHWFVLVE